MNDLHSSKQFDVVIIGAGHNGLVAAAYLAKAGLHVLVVERRDELGGSAGTAEIFDGYKVNVGAVDAGLFMPKVARDLDLESHDLRWLEAPAVVNLLRPDGSALTIWRDLEKTTREIAHHSERDAVKYPAFLRVLAKFTDVLQGMLLAAPPSLPQLQAGELLPWLGTALKVKTLGKQDMMEFLRVLPMPVADWLGEWFESELLKAAIGAGSVRGHALGPMSSGTAFLLLYHAMHAGQAGFRASRFVRGGMGIFSEALASAARRSGVEIVAGKQVSKVVLEDGKAAGIQLEGGVTIRARAVVSSADPRQTYFGLVGASNLPIGVVREVKNFRMRSSLARVTLALNKIPEFLSADQSDALDRLSGHNLICPSLEYLEQAFDDIKYGSFSSHPMLDFVIPTIIDSTLAPPGMHLMEVDVYYAPYELHSATWEEKRLDFIEAVIVTLEAYAPGIRESIAKTHLLTPADMEAVLGLTGGDIYHGQMGLDQLLMMRPVAGYGRYRTPVENLYLCGAGTHPGGGVTGAPGYNAAREILGVLKKSKADF